MSVLVTAYLCRNLLDKHTYEGRMHSGRPDYKEKKYELIKAQARVMSRKIPLKNVPIALIHQGEKPIVGRAISAALVNDDKDWKVKFRIDTSQLKGMITKQFIESGLLTDVSLNHMPGFDANGEPDDEPIEISVCAKGAREGSTIEECVKAAKGFEELIKKATTTFNETYPQESIQSNPIPGDSMLVIEPIEAACKEHGKENCQHDQCDGYSALNHSSSGDSAMVDSLVSQGVDSGKKHPIIPETGEVEDSKELCGHKNPKNNCNLKGCEGNHKKNKKSNPDNYKPATVKPNTIEANKTIVNTDKDIKMSNPSENTNTNADGNVAAAADFIGIRDGSSEPTYEKQSGSLPDPSKLRNAGILPQNPGNNGNNNNRRPDADIEAEIERRVQERTRPNNNNQQRPSAPAAGNSNAQPPRQAPPQSQQPQQQQQQQQQPPASNNTIFSSGEEYTDLLHKTYRGGILTNNERKRLAELAVVDRQEKKALAERLAETEKRLAGAQSEIHEGSETFSTLLSEVTGMDKETLKKTNFTDLAKNANNVLAAHLFGGGQDSNSNYQMNDEDDFSDFAARMGNPTTNSSTSQYNTSQYSSSSSMETEPIAAAAGNGNRGATGMPRRQDNHNRYRGGNNNNHNNNNRTNTNSNTNPSSSNAMPRIQAFKVEKDEMYNQAGGWIAKEPNPLNPKIGQAPWALCAVDSYRVDPMLGKQAELGVIPIEVNAGQRDMNKGRRYY